jgi:hypothetical protein
MSAKEAQAEVVYLLRVSRFDRKLSSINQLTGKIGNREQEWPPYVS